MYSIMVKVEGIESKRRSASMLHVIIGFFLVARGTDYYSRVLLFGNFSPAFPFFVIAAISIAYGLFRRKLDPDAKYNHWLRLTQVVAFSVLGFLVMPVSKPVEFIPLFLFAIVSILLLFAERKIFQDTVIRLEKNGVIIPGTYRDHLVPWEALNEVIVREDFLTLFHVKKKYLQYQVMQDLSTLETAKMNGFCKEMIEAKTGAEAER
jgi:hypothetical protein